QQMYKLFMGNKLHANHPTSTSERSVIDLVVAGVLCLANYQRKIL
ncbi:6100_t:CDS:2, partial [Rhizophagus irregularis]